MKSGQRWVTPPTLPPGVHRRTTAPRVWSAALATSVPNLPRSGGSRGGGSTQATPPVPPPPTPCRGPRTVTLNGQMFFYKLTLKESLSHGGGGDRRAEQWYTHTHTYTHVKKHLSLLFLYRTLSNQTRKRTFQRICFESFIFCKISQHCVSLNLPFLYIIPSCVFLCPLVRIWFFDAGYLNGDSWRKKKRTHFSRWLVLTWISFCWSSSLSGIKPSPTHLYFAFFFGTSVPTIFTKLQTIRGERRRSLETLAPSLNRHSWDY